MSKSTKATVKRALRKRVLPTLLDAEATLRSPAARAVTTRGRPSRSQARDTYTNPRDWSYAVFDLPARSPASSRTRPGYRWPTRRSLRLPACCAICC